MGWAVALMGWAGVLVGWAGGFGRPSPGQPLPPTPVVVPLQWGERPSKWTGRALSESYHPPGAVSQYMHELEPGDTALFKHIKFNVKVRVSSSVFKSQRSWHASAHTPLRPLDPLPVRRHTSHHDDLRRCGPCADDSGERVTPRSTSEWQTEQS